MINYEELNKMTRGELEDSIIELYSREGNLEFPDTLHMMLMQNRLTSWITDDKNEGN